VPDTRWQPQPHALCQVAEDEDKLSPPGTWQVLAHGPTSPSSWWLMPISDEAVRWAAANPNQVISRCIEIPGSRLRSNHQFALHRGQPRGA
jgi:hypothetical protein